jgi:hypothetical protein
MTTKGHMNPTSRVSKTTSQAGENSQSCQTNGPEHTIVSSIPRDLIFTRNNGRRAVSPEKRSREVAKLEQRVSKFKIDANIIGFLNSLIRILDEKSIKQFISNQMLNN